MVCLQKDSSEEWSGFSLNGCLFAAGRIGKSVIVILMTS